ncbi:MAG: hypothetical protein P9L92_10290 [Candidatus Electryonea clarkiae]|nr:hypothetical protein [Candidatus Electryonea clarkiae]MDP8285577.1 hypothetical protein [Candidatus Electryonea clarkiae]
MAQKSVVGNETVHLSVAKLIARDINVQPADSKYELIKKSKCKGNKFEKSSFNHQMQHSRHINNVVGIILVIVFVVILIHDIHLPAGDTHGNENSVPVSTDSQTSDHSDGCDESCLCVIHVLEKSLGFLRYQSENIIAVSTIRLAEDLMPESVILKPIDHPPEV